MNVLLEIFIVFLLFFILFYAYQSVRSDAISKIRKKWILSNDVRWSKYTGMQMLNIKKSNWFGLKYPKEKDYK